MLKTKENEKETKEKKGNMESKYIPIALPMDAKQNYQKVKDTHRYRLVQPQKLEQEIERANSVFYGNDVNDIFFQAIDDHIFCNIDENGIFFKGIIEGKLFEYTPDNLLVDFKAILQDIIMKIKSIPSQKSYAPLITRLKNYPSYIPLLHTIYDQTIDDYWNKIHKDVGLVRKKKKIR